MSRSLGVMRVGWELKTNHSRPSYRYVLIVSCGPTLLDFQCVIMHGEEERVGPRETKVFVSPSVY